MQTSDPLFRRPQKAYFRDIQRFRSLLGERDWSELRFYETVVEHNPKSGKAAFRVLVVCGLHLFILDPRQLKAANIKSRERLWAGELAYPPIAYSAIHKISIVSGRVDVFADDNINEATQNIRIHCDVHHIVRGKKVKTKAKPAKVQKSSTNKKKRNEKSLNIIPNNHPSAVTPSQREQVDHVETCTVNIDLISWESKQLAYFHMYNAWTSALTLASLGPSLRGSVGIYSQAEAMELYEQFLPQLLYKPTSSREPSALFLRSKSRSIEAIALHLVSNEHFKALFLGRQRMWQFAISEIKSQWLMPDRSSERMRYVHSLFQLMQCALFNCSNLAESRKLLNPLPLDFGGMMHVLTLNFAQSGKKQHFSNPPNKQLRLQRRASRMGSVCVDKTASPLFSDGEEDEDDYNSDENGYEDEMKDDDEEEFMDAERQVQRENLRAARAAAFGARATRARPHTEKPSIVVSFPDKKILGAIDEMQVGILVAFNEVIVCGINLGDKNVDSSLAEWFASRSQVQQRLVAYIRSLVKLIERYNSEVEAHQHKGHSSNEDIEYDDAGMQRPLASKSNRRRLKQLGSRVFQHAKLFNVLMHGDSQNREFVVMECGDEELRFYLFRDDFLKHLNCGNVLDRASTDLLIDVRDTIRDLDGE